MVMVSVGGRPAPYPVLGVQVQVGSVVSHRHQMVVDTGAAAVVLPWSTAVMLGVEDAARAAPAVRFEGMGRTGIARRMVASLWLPRAVPVADVTVHFLEGATSIAGFDGLLGQLGFLDRLRLVQLGHHTPPSFVLDDE